MKTDKLTSTTPKQIPLVHSKLSLQTSGNPGAALTSPKEAPQSALGVGLSWLRLLKEQTLSIRNRKGISPLFTPPTRTEQGQIH